MTATCMSAYEINSQQGRSKNHSVLNAINLQNAELNRFEAKVQVTHKKIKCVWVHFTCINKSFAGKNAVTDRIYFLQVSRKK